MVSPGPVAVKTGQRFGTPIRIEAPGFGHCDQKLVRILCGH
jgi:hypothetical protein